MNAAQAFIAFLKCEATNAEERAKSLRSTAAAIEANVDVRKKKRKRDTKTKRGPTGYSLFFSESYENIKKTGQNLDSKQVLLLIARQWNEIGQEEKQAWQLKAEQLKQVNAAASTEAGEMLAMGDEEGEEPLEEDWNEKKRASRKAPPPEPDMTAQI